jgi:superoxide dismutase, Cu-Zn family
VKWLLAAGLLLASATTVNAQTASAELHTADGQSLATATFTQARDEVLISIAFANRNALVGTHAIQIHSESQCSTPRSIPGPIFNPYQKQHGLQNPDGPMAGDLPNLVVGPAGVAVYNLSAPLLTVPGLLESPGTSLVVFAQPDDNTSQPNGNAGQRIACGAIRGAQPARGLDSSDSSLVMAVIGGLLFAGGIVLRRSP